MNRTILTVSLDKELAKQLNRVCEETDRPRSRLVAQALREYLEELEDLEIAVARLHNPKEGRLTERALRKKLGLSN